MLVAETVENPAHEAARILLAEAYEKAKMPDEAVKTWQQLMALSHHEANLQKARRGLGRLERQRLDRLMKVDPTRAVKPRDPDPFRIAMPEVDWTGLEKIEDSDYLPAILPPPRGA